MGYIKHQHLLVEVSDKSAKKVKKQAIKIFGEDRVSQILKSVANGYEWIFIASDGSKEGWDTSDKGDTQRKEFVDWVEDNFSDDTNFLKVGWADIHEIQHGDDSPYIQQLTSF